MELIDTGLKDLLPRAQSKVRRLGVNLEEAVEDIHHRSTKGCLPQAECAKQDKKVSEGKKNKTRVGNISSDKKMRGN